MRKDGGSIGRVRRAPVSRALGFACLLGLAACSSDEVAFSDPNVPTGCPRVRIVDGLDTVTQFRDGPGRDLTDVVARGLIADFSGECEYGESDVTVDLDLIIGAEKGPAASGDSARLVYFVAVMDPQQNILNKKEFDSEFVFEGSATRAAFTEELAQVIPLKQLGDGQFYQILVGFQVTPEQFEFNRR